jgi:multiple sugar transport system permease protein
LQTANKTDLPGSRAGLAGSDAAIHGQRSPLGRAWFKAISVFENEGVLGYTLMVPAMALILLFIAYPFALGVMLSFTDKLVGKDWHYIGLQNFRDILDSQIFRETIFNTILFTFMATVFKSVLGMSLALLLNRKFALSRATRATVLLPFIVPTVLSSLAWLWMFDATFSVFNWVGRFFWQMDITVLGTTIKPNLGYFKGINWLGDPFWAMSSIIIANVWRGVPFFAISFLAGLQTVPVELYDAGDIDGANGWQKFWTITLPLIKPIAVVVVVFSIVVTFSDFQLVYVLTRGGPHNSTHLFATYAYQLSMASGNLGQGAAVALFMFPILALVIIGQLWYLRRAETA